MRDRGPLPWAGGAINKKKNSFQPTSEYTYNNGTVQRSFEPPPQARPKPDSTPPKGRSWVCRGGGGGGGSRGSKLQNSLGAQFLSQNDDFLQGVGFKYSPTWSGK